MADSWLTCDQDGCSGARTGDETRCLAHVGAEERGATLKRFSEGGELDVRGVTISDALFREIFDAAPRDADERRTFSAAWFDGATFKGSARFVKATFESDARFAGATFQGIARFDGPTAKGIFRGAGATFKGSARFERATFEGAARFDKATFKGSARFEGATFQGDARFAGATFKGMAGFDEATVQGDAGFHGAKFQGSAGFHGAKFQGDARFDEATFSGGGAWFGGATFESDARFVKATFESHAGFDGATFKGSAGFEGATFQGDARFAGATFKGMARFDEATVQGDAGFHGATFQGSAGFHGAKFQGDARFDKATFKDDVPVLGPIEVAGRLVLDGVQFASPVRIEADASVLTCRRGRFPGGVRFDVSRADVRVDDTDLSVPSLLTGPSANGPAETAKQPKLLSLRGANVAGLALGNVNLADCRFAGAHNLDKLRLEAGTTFGRSPAVAGWEQRQVIAEESAWRTRPDARAGRWKPPQWFDNEDHPKALSPGAVAVLYRALRKGREDAKDEPGAADFYYGEMEMRRHDRETGANRWRGRASRIVLTAYWLVSGYGLRAGRSLVALAVVMAVSAAVFRLWGFTHPATYWKSLLFAFRSTISLTDAQVNLTAWGGLFQALLRLTGPALLALTLLALRGRVKR